MFKTKKENEKLKVRIHELEEILCPCEQHDYIEVERAIKTDCTGGVIDCWHVSKYMCQRCKKVIYKDNRF